MLNVLLGDIKTMRKVCNLDSIGKIKRRMHPEGRGCIDCGTLLSRHGKWRCFDCHIKYLRTLVLDKNPAFKGDKASSVAINRAIIVRFGHANNCANINCKGLSRQYKWARLKAKEGRRGGIWIPLCNSCRLKLSEIYMHNESTEKME